MSRISKKKSISPFLVGLNIILLFMAKDIYCSQPNQPISKENISSFMESKYWGDRILAAQHVTKIFQNDTLKAVQTIINGIDREIALQTTEFVKTGAYPEYTVDIIRQYTYSLSQIGIDAKDTIYSLAFSAPAKRKTTLIIALGLMGDKRIHPEIREIVLNDTNPYMRALAALSLVVYNDTMDVPILIQALSDSYSVVVKTDYAMPDGKLSRVDYPVRSAANNTLVDMGYEILKDPVSGRINARRRK